MATLCCSLASWPLDSPERRFRLPETGIGASRRHRFVRRPVLRIVSRKNDVFGVLTSIVRTGKDGLEAATNLLPESVPRPVAQVAAVLLGGTISLFILRSLLSTAAFILGIAGLVYVVYKYLDKDDDDPDEDKPDAALEEARRIMKKYR